MFSPKLIFHWTVIVYVNINYILGFYQSADSSFLLSSNIGPPARPCEAKCKVRARNDSARTEGSRAFLDNSRARALPDKIELVREMTSRGVRIHLARFTRNAVRGI